jgi:diguanylate cyclase (GGDEF)-like protein/PAS domain S-box-containing protein
LETLDTIEHWRARIFSSLLNFVLISGAITAVPSVAAAVAYDMWSVVGVDICALAWLIGIWWFKRLPYVLRAANFLALLFMVGTGLMISVGSISLIYLFASSMLAAILLGMRQALMSLACASAIVFVLCWSGLAQLHFLALADGSFMAALIVTINFVFVGAVITVSCSMLLNGLTKSLERVAETAESLEQGKGELQSLNNELRLTATAVARLNDMVAIARVNRDGGAQPIIFVNDAFERHTGYSRTEVLGREWDMLLGAEKDSPAARRVARAVARTEAVSAELLYHTRSGAPYWVEMELMPFADAGGKKTHWVAVGRDITERKKSENDIHRLAFYDVLTGLPNRRLLVDRIDTLLAAAQKGTHFGAVLFIDLDRFKTINDARGHAIGDAVLRHAAERLSAAAGPADTVARIGGDEFVVLLPDLGDDFDGATAAALAMADKLRHAITERCEIEGQPYASSASIGVSMLPKTGQTAHDLLREADTAMYRAKLAGRNGIAIFEATMRAEVEQRLTLERDLAAALAQGELSTFVQLQVDCAGEPSGAELLARWRRADGSYIPPDQFIPVAEESGLILQLGEWALREACLTVRRLAHAGYRFPLSVNVSPSQFRQQDFVDRVRAVLQETGAPAGQLIFELTEGLLVDALDGTLVRMRELAALGIRLSIDDFGTGYSSLAYLTRMPLFELKIDRSFIHHTPADANCTAIVQSILAMAGHLGLRTVAEGVETHEQASFLAANGAGGLQGFLFARPMPLPDLIALLDAGPSGFPDAMDQDIFTTVS